MNKFRYFWYDGQVKLLFLCLIPIFLICCYYIVAIKFQDLIPLFPTNFDPATTSKINDIITNISYSICVSIFTYILTISIPTLYGLNSGYGYLKAHIKSYFESWAMLYCILKYSLQITSSYADNFSFVKLKEQKSLNQEHPEILNLIGLGNKDIAYNALINLNLIEHFHSIISLKQNNIPSKLIGEIFLLNNQITPIIRHHIELLDKAITTAAEVSRLLMPYRDSIDSHFMLLSEIELKFVGKELRSQLNNIEPIKLELY